MGLSSNSVIHFTRKISSLKGILTSDFAIRYCLEEVHSQNDHIKMLIPMVSFCDIPFSQIITQVNSYGSYGIGLSKQWAESNGLNPVLYLEKQSELTENVISNLKLTLRNGSQKKISEFSLETKQARDIFRYIKNYQGNLTRVGKSTIKDYRFSDEREWRYVLSPILDYQFYLNVKSSSKETISKLKNNYNNKLNSQRLNYTPEDVNYIIIQKESERDGIIQTIEKSKGKYSHTEVKRLTSRIISVEQLRTDF